MVVWTSLALVLCSVLVLVLAVQSGGRRCSGRRPAATGATRSVSSGYTQVGEGETVLHHGSGRDRLVGRQEEFFKNTRILPAGPGLYDALGGFSLAVWA